MLRKINSNVIVKNISLSLLGVLVAFSLIVAFDKVQGASHFDLPKTANAASPVVKQLSQQVEPAIATNATWIQCRPVRVATYASHIHVMCAESVGGIAFFALSTSNAAHAARVLSVLSTAHVASKMLNILYDPDDTSGAAIGCKVNNCRLILVAEMSE